MSSKAISFKFGALANAWSPIDETEAGTWILSTFRRKKAFPSIAVTPPGILTSGEDPLYPRRTPESTMKPPASPGCTLMRAEAVYVQLPDVAAAVTVASPEAFLASSLTWSPLGGDGLDGDDRVGTRPRQLRPPQ